MQNSIKGSCHCGAVEFELNRKPKLTVNCHCDACKKRNGSAFSTYAAVPEKDLSVIKGEETIKQYEIKDEGIKHFCAECGSPIYNKNLRYPGLYMIYYGALEHASEFTPTFNVYCESKHKWVESISGIMSFAGPIEK